MALSDDTLLAVLRDVAGAIRTALDQAPDWRAAGLRDDQYEIDLYADSAALRILDRAGLGVLSEESGITRPDAETMVIVDPVDGSTNASLGLPWFATSLCAVDAGGPRVALVVNQYTGTAFHAVRGGGAFRDGAPIQASKCVELADAIVAVNAYSVPPIGWRQFRRLGSSALDLCAVAAGQLDGFVDLTAGEHGVWDYAGGLLICQEAGAVVTDIDDRELVVRSVSERRGPVAACTPELHAQLVTARRAAGPTNSLSR